MNLELFKNSKNISTKSNVTYSHSPLLDKVPDSAAKEWKNNQNIQLFTWRRSNSFLRDIRTLRRKTQKRFKQTVNIFRQLTKKYQTYNRTYFSGDCIDTIILLGALLKQCFGVIHDTGVFKRISF